MTTNPEEYQSEAKEKIISAVSDWWTEHNAPYLLSALGQNLKHQFSALGHDGSVKFSEFVKQRFSDELKFTAVKGAGAVAPKYADLTIDTFAPEMREVRSGVRFLKPIFTAFRKNNLEAGKVRHVFRVSWGYKYDDFSPDADKPAGYLFTLNSNDIASDAELDSELSDRMVKFFQTKNLDYGPFVDRNMNRTAEKHQESENDLLHPNHKADHSLLDALLGALSPGDMSRITMPLDIVYSLKNRIR